MIPEQTFHSFKVNFCPVPAPKDDAMKGVNEAEEKGLPRAEAFKKTGSAYAQMHGTRPGTIGLVLASSPVALLSWYVIAMIMFSHDPDWNLQDWRQVLGVD